MIIRQPHYYLSIIIFLSLLIKIFALYYFDYSHFVDVKTYMSTGQELFDNFYTQNEFVMPGYPVLLYITSFLFPPEITNLIISSLSIYIFYLLVEVIFKDKLLCFISSATFAFYPFNLFYSISGLSENFFLLIFLLSLYFFYKKKIDVGIIFLIISFLIRPIYDYIGLIILLFFVKYIYNFPTKKIYRYLLKYLIIYVVLFSPWWFHNYLKYGEFIRTNLTANHVLYAGNNPSNTTGGGVRFDQADLEEFPERFDKIIVDYNYEDLRGSDGFIIKNDIMYYEEGDKASLVRDKLYKNKAIEYITNNPYIFFENAVKKLKLLWAIKPRSSEFDGTFYSIVTSLTLVSLYIFSILGFGVFLLKNRVSLRTISPFILIFLYTNFVHMVTIGSMRYRFILDWILLIFASYFISFFLSKKRFLND